MKKPLSIVQIAIGLILLAKALVLPIPMPPNTSLTRPMLLDFGSWTYLRQVRHWKEQADAFEKLAAGERDRYGLSSATTSNLRWAWTFLIGSSVLGLALIGTGLRRDN